MRGRNSSGGGHSVQPAVNKLITPHTSDSPEVLNLLNSMHYTENHHRNVLSPELDLVSQNRLEENLKKETPETCLLHISK